MADQKNVGNSLGLLTILGLIFVTLKLAGIGQVATWSWWWVTCPFWIGYGLVFLIFGTGMLVLFFSTIIGGIIVLLSKKQKKGMR